MVFGDKTLRSFLSLMKSWGWGLHDAISALIRRGTRESAFLSLLWDSERPSASQEGSSYQELIWPTSQSWAPQLPKLWENRFLSLLPSLWNFVMADVLLKTTNLWFPVSWKMAIHWCFILTLSISFRKPGNCKLKWLANYSKIFCLIFITISLVLLLSYFFLWECSIL